MDPLYASPPRRVAQLHKAEAWARNLIDGELHGTRQKLICRGGATVDHDLALSELPASDECLMDVTTENRFHLGERYQRLPQSLAILEANRVEPGRAHRQGRMMHRQQGGTLILGEPCHQPGDPRITQLTMSEPGRMGVGHHQPPAPQVNDLLNGVNITHLRRLIVIAAKPEPGALQRRKNLPGVLIGSHRTIVADIPGHNDHIVCASRTAATTASS